MNDCGGRYNRRAVAVNRSFFRPATVAGRWRQPARRELADGLGLRNAERGGDTRAIRRTSLVTIVDVADFDFLGCVGRAARGIFEQRLPLRSADQTEKRAGLRIVVVNTMIPVVGRTVDGKRWFAKIRLLLPIPVAVRLRAWCAAVVAVNAHRTIAVIAVDGAARGIDRNPVLIDAQSITLGIALKEQSCLQHLVRRATDTGDDSGRIEGRLLDFGEEVFRVAVKRHDADVDQRVVFVQPDLDQIGFRARWLADAGLRAATSGNPGCFWASACGCEGGFHGVVQIREFKRVAEEKTGVLLPTRSRSPSSV